MRTGTSITAKFILLAMPALGGAYVPRDAENNMPDMDSLHSTSFQTSLYSYVPPSGALPPDFAGPPPCSAAPGPEPREPEKPAPLVVIDPGHGGADPGAPSPYMALREIDVIDAVSARLGEKLEAAGYDVAYTRKPYEQLEVPSRYKAGGKTLSTRQIRPYIAHKLADEGQYKHLYFISIHANAHATDPDMSGSMVLAGARSNGNGKVDFNGPALGRESVEFARSLARSLDIHGAPSVYRTSDATVVSLFDQLDHEPGFRAGALLELGYLTNREDAARLREMVRKPDAVVQKIMDGITGYHQKVTNDMRRSVKAGQPPAPHAKGV